MTSLNRKKQLVLLQLEQYDTKRYLKVRNKSFDEDLVNRIRWTFRLRLTLWLSSFIGIVLSNILIGSVVRLGEGILWIWVKTRIGKLKSKGLKVVAIAGSYGKTSVKQYSYDILRQKYQVVATPESFNTVFGIAKCLRWEVSQNTQIFLVEIGAYHIGDLNYLLRMIQPDLGLLTGIARQHLERFGSYENIKRAKSEIASYMKEVGGKLIANGSDSAVKEVVESTLGKYIFYKGQNRREINSNGAKELAKEFGMIQAEIDKAKIREVKNRFEMTTKRYGMAVIDDSFSSNDVGFVDAVKHLGQQSKYFRILVTPGIVELGDLSNAIHSELGKTILGNVDLAIFVGKSDRTTSLAKALGDQVKVKWIDKTLQFVEVVKKLKLKKKPLVLIENDLTENY